MLEIENGAASFYHPNNIEVGKGRILWAKATTDTSGIVHDEGWVLPGGIRTQSNHEARAAAMRIHSMAGPV